MKITEHIGYIAITQWEFFSPEITFTCGQCFRWFPIGDGKYQGVAFGRELTVWSDADTTYMTCSEKEFQDVWKTYFDVERSYETLAQSFQNNDFLKEAVEFGRGLRLLTQDPWETLCSFLISQCNNIVRIQQIIQKLAVTFGDRKDQYFAFPTAQQLAQMSITDLQGLKAGYRAEYILSAAKAVADGTISFAELKKMDTESARKKVMCLRGVGRKVADCFLLFGLQKYDAFPVDTWMKKARQHYDEKEEITDFGAYAGIAQQYIFHYMRLGKKTEKQAFPMAQQKNT